MKCDKCGGLMIYERFLSQEFEDFSGMGDALPAERSLMK